MPLDPLQEEVARVALHLTEAGHVALAGGGAMLAHEFVDRPTNDIDLFTPEAGEVGPVTDALREALHGLGYTVELTRREDTFSRLQVTAADGRQSTPAITRWQSAEVRVFHVPSQSRCVPARHRLSWHGRTVTRAGPRADAAVPLAEHLPEALKQLAYDWSATRCGLLHQLMHSSVLVLHVY